MRVFAVGSREWGGGARETQTYAQDQGMPPQKPSEENKLNRASSVSRNAGGVNVSARALLAKPRSAGNDMTWTIFVASFQHEDHATVSAAAIVAALESATEGEKDELLRGA